MSDPIPLQNSSAAAYMEIEGADIEYGPAEGPGGRPIVYVTPGGAVGQPGQTDLNVADGLNILTAEEFKRANIKLIDDSIIVSARIQVPSVSDNATGAWRRNFCNTTAFDITIEDEDGHNYIIGAGLSQDLICDTAGPRAAITGV